MLNDSNNIVPVEMPDAPQVDESFHVRDAATANWVLRKILAARRYAECVREWAAAEVKRAQREEEFFLVRFGGELEEWCRRQIQEDGGRRRSVNLPAGVMGFRRTPTGLEVADEQKVIDWCRRHLSQAIVIRESLSKTVLKEHLKQTGEVPEGAEIRGGDERFYIR
jgi:phage host-nuclease inhibitor protein Gam